MNLSLGRYIFGGKRAIHPASAKTIEGLLIVINNYMSVSPSIQKLVNVYDNHIVAGILTGY